MAKAKAANSNKVSFGKRKGGKAQKTKGPKDKPTKKNVGQGQSQNQVQPYYNLLIDTQIRK